MLACILYIYIYIYLTTHAHRYTYILCIYIYISRHAHRGIYIYIHTYTHTRLYIYVCIYINQWCPSTYLYWVNTQKLLAISTSIFGFLVHVVDILQMRTFQRWTAPGPFFPGKIKCNVLGPDSGFNMKFELPSPIDDSVDVTWWCWCQSNDVESIWMSWFQLYTDFFADWTWSKYQGFEATSRTFFESSWFASCETNRSKRRSHKWCPQTPPHATSPNACFDKFKGRGCSRISLSASANWPIFRGVGHVEFD